MPYSYKGSNTRFLEVREQPIYDDSLRKCKYCGEKFKVEDFPININGHRSKVCAKCKPKFF